MANYRLAKEQGLSLVPLINKIDLPAAEPARVAQEVWNGGGGVSFDACPPGTRRYMLCPPPPVSTSTDRCVASVIC